MFVIRKFDNRDLVIRNLLIRNFGIGNFGLSLFVEQASAGTKVQKKLLCAVCIICKKSWNVRDSDGNVFIPFLC
jgi:hypothetical protein